MAAVKASAADSAAAANDLLTAKDPQAFFSLATACAKPNPEKVAAYGRQLTDIVSATKEEFSKVADAQVAEVQSKVSALVDSITKNAPAGSENVIAMFKSSVANAHDGYAKMNSVAKQAIEATEAHVAKASDQLKQVVKKAAAK
jgi:phasin family protein